jgi:hypothetical protein
MITECLQMPLNGHGMAPLELIEILLTYFLGKHVLFRESDRA